MVIVSEEWFTGIGSLEVKERRLTLAIIDIGERGLKWFFDADGFFYALEWRGRLQRDLGAWLGLKRQREAYDILPGIKITCGAALALTQSHVNQFQEALNSTDLQALLAAQPPDRLVDRELMNTFLGE
jgi:hypothetical protein